MLGTLITARIIGKELFGTLSVAQSTAGTAGTLAGLALAVTTTKYVAELRRTEPVRAAHIIALNLVVSITLAAVMSILLFLSAPWIASNAFSDDGLTSELEIAAVPLFFLTVSGAQTGVLAGLEEFKLMAKLNCVRALAALPLVAMAATFAGLRGAVWALAINPALACILNQISIHFACPSLKLQIRLKDSFREWLTVWNFSVPALISGALNAPVLWLAYAMLVNRPDGYKEMGTFNAANQWRTALLFIPGVIGQALLPILSERYRADREDFNQLLRRSLAATVVIVSVTAAPICAASATIMRLYGEGFADGWPTLSLLACASVPAAWCSIIGQALNSSGKLWVGCALNFVWASVLLFSGLFWISRWGSVGLACSVLLAYSVHAVTVTYYARSNRERTYSMWGTCDVERS